MRKTSWAVVVVIAAGIALAAPASAQLIDGAGSAGKIAKFIDANTIGNSIITEGAGAVSVAGSTTGTALLVDNASTGFLARLRQAGSTKFQITSSGTVGIGTLLFTPAARLHVRGDGTASSLNRIRLENGTKRLDLRADGSQVDIETTTNKLFIKSEAAGGNNVVVLQPSGGRVGIGTDTPLTTLDVNGALTLRGGSDLAEPFEVGDKAIEPGMVLSIDPDEPGELRLATEPYDSKVVGVASGAGGIKPGMLMFQEGQMEGNLPVALVGRVYCWCDASNGAIKPGDLLTSSATPGHAMKATERWRANGTILGKAMGSLREGKGLVLIVVALQ